MKANGTLLVVFKSPSGYDQPDFGAVIDCELEERDDVKELAFGLERSIEPTQALAQFCASVVASRLGCGALAGLAPRRRWRNPGSPGAWRNLPGVHVGEIWIVRDYVDIISRHLYNRNVDLTPLNRLWSVDHTNLVANHGVAMDGKLSCLDVAVRLNVMESSVRCYRMRAEKERKRLASENSPHPEFAAFVGERYRKGT